MRDEASETLHILNQLLQVDFRKISITWVVVMVGTVGTQKTIPNIEIER